jgi:hypothetical protein
VEVAGLDETRVGGNEIPRAEADDVAGHELGTRQLPPRPVALHGRGRDDRLAQPLGRRRRARGLDGVEQHAQGDRADDDERVHRVARPRRHAARREQDEHERARELRHDVAHEADVHRARELVRAGGREATPGLGLRESARGR